MATKIAVRALTESKYQVTIDDRGSATSHEITMTRDDIERYAPGAAAETLVRASFEFLLEREPKEAILSHFALTVIERYFPEYPRRIRTMMGAS